ncbi:hypothetical protein [Natronolimnobius baerhuensis]|uniref:hypothetical protein n=1 Tax=Natronolimnobius baerhuensis TaxID=253108 RepID=UPI001124E721|nr:hypothetical protein [Natronolimnobius baerhuensis]
MKRRGLLLGLTAGAVGLAGCTSSEDEPSPLDAAVEITDALCDETETRTELHRESEGKVVADGVVTNLAAGEGLRSILLTPQEDEPNEGPLLCVIETRERAEDGVDCAGSVSYTAVIEFDPSRYAEVEVLNRDDEYAESIDL